MNETKRDEKKKGLIIYLPIHPKPCEILVFVFV